MLRMRSTLISLTLLCLLCTAGRSVAQEAPGSAPAVAEEQLPSVDARQERGLVALSNQFVPKGQWIVGISASYSTHTNDAYTFLVVDDIQSNGYNVKVSPTLAYAITNNMALGVKFTYGRTLLALDSADIDLGDDQTGIDLSVDFYHALKHSYTGGIVWRQYIPLGQSKRFALFNEVQLAFGGSQARFATDSPVRGTYEKGFNCALGISPGLVAFATNNLAFEVNVGVLGISYNRTQQVHNQVTVGKQSSSAMNFKINILSIGLGVSFYL